MNAGSAGNVASVANAFRRAGEDAKVVGSLASAQGAAGLVIPGVGAFSAVKGISDALGGKECAGKIDVPVLCICLGMQALFECSEESEGDGLFVIEGSVRKLKGDVRLPQLGWNRVKLSVEGKLDPLFSGISDGEYFYFANSFAAFPKKQEAVLGSTEYGQEFASAVRKANFWGVQFHPEKSGKAGQALIGNFASICRRLGK